MKKLKKLSINRMNVFDVINEREQMELKGGTTYSIYEMEEAIEGGYWTGGMVEGLGYVAATVDVQPGFWDKLRYRASIAHSCPHCLEANTELCDAGHSITDYKGGGTGAGIEVLFEHWIYGWHDGY